MPSLGTAISVATFGTIELTTEVGGDLYFDGNKLGAVQANTLIPIEKVSTGNHALEIRGAENWKTTVMVEKDKKASVTAKTTAIANTTTTANNNAATKSTTTENTGTKVDLPSRQTFTANGVSFDMHTIEGGTFTMGSPSSEADRGSDETQHQVTLSGFQMGKHEVTQKLWRAVMGNNPSGFQNCDDCPVEKVSWEDCQKFIKKLNKLTDQSFRLPTEAEWEFAARGGNKSNSNKWAGSGSVDGVGWYDQNSGSKTHPVGQKQANEQGLHDMTGNVWEWCQDWYGDYSSSSQTNPQGPNSGSLRVRRGGSWCSFATNARVAGRFVSAPDVRGVDLGFRLCRSL